jgi:hypothetical protein
MALKHCARCNHMSASLEKDVCLTCSLKELREWRSGKRRVFWRVRWFNGNHKTPLDYNHETRANAMHEARHLRSLSYNSATRNAAVKLYRVTVGPAKKEEAG